MKVNGKIKNKKVKKTNDTMSPDSPVIIKVINELHKLIDHIQFIDINQNDINGNSKGYLSYIFYFIF